MTKQKILYFGLTIFAAGAAAGTYSVAKDRREKQQALFVIAFSGVIFLLLFLHETKSKKPKVISEPKN